MTINVLFVSIAKYEKSWVHNSPAKSEWLYASLYNQNLSKLAEHKNGEMNLMTVCYRQPWKMHIDNWSIFNYIK